MIDERERMVDEGPVLYTSQDISYPVGKDIWTSPQTPRYLLHIADSVIQCQAYAIATRGMSWQL